MNVWKVVPSVRVGADLDAGFKTSSRRRERRPAGIARGRIAAGLLAVWSTIRLRDRARLRVDHRAAGLRVGACPASARSRNIRTSVSSAGSVVGGAELGLVLDQVVERAIDRAQAQCHARVRDQGE